MSKKTPIIGLLIITANIVLYYAYNYHLAGVYTYPLDDTYIHLSVAKNIALFDVWGITKYQFSSTISSPLYGLILSLFIKIVGVYDSIPLVFNIILIVPFFYLAHQLLKRYNTWMYNVGIIAITYIPIMHLQVLTGMEHMLQIVLILSTLFVVENYLKNNTIKQFISLLVSSTLLVACRYESLFLILALCVVLFFSKEYIRSIILGLVVLVPVVLYGAFSIHNGAEFFPNSLLIKGNTSTNPIHAIYTVAERMLSNEYLFFIILGCIYLLISSLKSKTLVLSDFFRTNWLSITLVITILLHAAFADFGWLYRYDSYIKAMAILALLPILIIINYPKLKNIIPTAILVGFVFFTSGQIRASYNKIKASNNIFEQQVQMANFLKQHYNTAIVLANDIGAISYYTDIHLIDIIGLGTDSIQKLRKEEHWDVFYNQSILDYLNVNKPEIAIIYDDWFNTIPSNFHKVGQWTIKDNVICGSDKVNFYAVGKENIAELEKRLRIFGESELDEDVEFKLFATTE